MLSHNADRDTKTITFLFEQKAPADGVDPSSLTLILDRFLRSSFARVTEKLVGIHFNQTNPRLFSLNENTLTLTVSLKFSSPHAFHTALARLTAAGVLPAQPEA